MTAPTTQAQRQQQRREQAAAAALAAYLAMPSPPSLDIIRTLINLGLPRVSARAAVGMVTTYPEPPMVPTGAAMRAMQRTNTLRRAQYVIAAARRITRSLADGRSQGRKRSEALAAAVSAERRYYQAHTVAQANRRQAAADVDLAADTVGRTRPTATAGPVRQPGRVLLGWHSVRDNRTTPECRRAHGKVFYADSPPRIGYPGTVHVHCRCRPVAPTSRQLVDGGTVAEPSAHAA